MSPTGIEFGSSAAERNGPRSLMVRSQRLEHLVLDMVLQSMTPRPEIIDDLDRLSLLARSVTGDQRTRYLLPILSFARQHGVPLQLIAPSEDPIRWWSEALWEVRQARNVAAHHHLDSSAQKGLHMALQAAEAVCATFGLRESDRDELRDQPIQQGAWKTSVEIAGDMASSVLGGSRIFIGGPRSGKSAQGDGMVRLQLAHHPWPGSARAITSDLIGALGTNVHAPSSVTRCVRLCVAALAGRLLFVDDVDCAYGPCMHADSVSSHLFKRLAAVVPVAFSAERIPEWWPSEWEQVRLDSTPQGEPAGGWRNYWEDRFRRRPLTVAVRRILRVLSSASEPMDPPQLAGRVDMFSGEVARLLEGLRPWVDRADGNPIPRYRLAIPSIAAAL